MKTCGWKSQQWICRETKLGLLALGFPRGERCWCPQWWKLVGAVLSTRPVDVLRWRLPGSSARAGHWEPGRSWCMADTDSPCPSPLFLPLSVHVSFAHLWLVWNQSRSSVQRPERVRKLIAHPTLLFLVRRTLSRGRVPFWHWGVLAGGWDGTGKMKLSTLFVQVFLASSIHLLLKLSRWPPVTSQSCFHSWISCPLDLVGRWRLRSLTLPLWWHLSILCDFYNS